MLEIIFCKLCLQGALFVGYRVEQLGIAIPFGVSVRSPLEAGRSV